jgi:multidrug efflux pump subunit AcrA (membrane-fusion protein)
VPCRVRVDNPRDVKVIIDGATSLDATAAPSGPPALVRGMFVTVTFHVDQPSPLLLIPERAVQPGKAVWIVEDGLLNEKRSLELIELIQVGDDAGEEQSYWLVEAAATGLKADDRVVVPPFGVLSDGEQVREEAAR